MFKHQAIFSAELVTKWNAGQHAEVRNVIRGLKNKAQAAYIAARVAILLGQDEAWSFIDFMDPNN
ncbi:hypothetical protein [Fimbriiglobus ruber]|uniref:Uncharacterized protein n=1 Tax=Fimbriiglobus ruber TaxID=1908690 RepID=A0A225DE77_9BACT|nr:hypothetical protein [Fimbriiglobus ruber]OWK35449.1 hypothetical protein FRUB_08012 [Fimbriiglobus ruber]